MSQKGNLYETNAKKTTKFCDDCYFNTNIQHTVYTLLYFVYYLPQQFIYTSTYLYKMCTELFNTQTMLHVFFLCVCD